MHWWIRGLFFDGMSKERKIICEGMEQYKKRQKYSLHFFGSNGKIQKQIQTYKVYLFVFIPHLPGEGC